MAVRHPARAPENNAFELGMRRVLWVRISISDAGVRAEVAGISHRRPIVRPLPLPRANALIRAGCPYVVRHDRPAGSDG